IEPSVIATPIMRPYAGREPLVSGRSGKATPPGRIGSTARAMQAKCRGRQADTARRNTTDVARLRRRGDRIEMLFAAVHESSYGSAPRRRGSLVEEDSTQRVVD